METSSRKNIILFAAAWIFFFARYILDFYLADLGEFASYAFELAFVVVMGFFLRDQLNLKVDFSKKVWITLFLTLIAGYVVFKAAIYGGILIPFEFDYLLTVFLLLVVAPILEELLFRFVFMNANSKVIKNKFIVVLLSALVFSLAHFNALRYVPEIVRGFVIYQGLYTLVLGSVTAMVYYVMTERRILAAIGVHFLFNLGFFLASQY
ncbi:CAAX amino terminal protease self- immunity [compost metagenome]